MLDGRGARGVRADRAARRLRRGGDPDAERAPADGDGYRLTGTKIWISNAPEAERYLVFATLDPAAGPSGDHGLPRREGHARVPLRRPREEDGHPRLPGGRARVRGRGRPGREPSRRRRARAIGSPCRRSAEGRISIAAACVGIARSALEQAAALPAASGRRSARRWPSSRDSGSCSPRWHATSRRHGR